jgi:hypothetical protein
MESGLNASTYNAVAVIRESLGRPFEPADLQRYPDRELLDTAAREYVATYNGGFDFIKNLQRTMPQFGLSAGQAKGALNTMYNEYRRSQSQATREIVTGQPDRRTLQPETVNASDIADGRYTVIHQDGTWHTYRIKPVEDGRYENLPAGTRIVLYMNGPDNENSYTGMAWLNANGTLRIWSRFMNDPQNSLLVQGLRFLVSSDTEGRVEAGYQYALKSSRCCKCGRTLTVPASIHRGMGPVCAGGGWD